MSLRLEDLYFERNGQVLFENITCELHPGDLLQVTGANGCGKSTLLRVIAGLIEPQQGNITWQKKSHQYVDHLHYLGHQNSIKSYLTVYENLKLYCALHYHSDQLIRPILTALKLNHLEKTLTLHLSAGQKRRLALARLLIVKKPLWILDEPNSGLDAEGQEYLQNAIAQHRAEGGIVIVAAHGVEKKNFYDLVVEKIPPDPPFSKGGTSCSSSPLLNKEGVISRIPPLKKGGRGDFISYISILHHEIVITRRQAFSWLTLLLFFVIVNCLFPIALGPDAELLTKIAPSMIWVTALLSILIAIDHLFRDDAQDGHLDLLLLSPHSFTLLVSCKILSFWLLYCLPLIILTPLLTTLAGLSFQVQFHLCIALLLGTPVLCLLGAIGSALTVGIRNSGALLPILIMPLYVPVLIFGSQTGTVAIMSALLLVSLAFSPYFTGAALRIGVTQ